MSFIAFFIALLLAFIDLLATNYNWARVNYFSRPGVLIVLIVWMWVAAGAGYPVYLFLLGLFFFLFDEILLLLPRAHPFLGLLSLLLAFLCYTWGFNYRNFPVTLATPFLIVLVALPAAQLYRRNLKSLTDEEKKRSLWLFSLYFIALSLMALSAMQTLVQPEWRWLTIPSWLVSIGAILFFISEGLRAPNRILSPITRSELLVKITYHLAQLSITLGVILNFTILANQK